MFPSTPSPAFPYRILEKVGEGAMGHVFRAEDVELGRRVAIKVVKPELLAALPPSEAHQVAERFLQEARAAAALTHPGAVVVHRVGTEDGCPFIAMEWLEGKTLEAILRDRRRLGVDQVVKLGLQVLGVLQAAHQAGVIHRDIKPANLLVSKDGRVKVADFGIARVRGAESLAHTQAGTILGTPAYAAPEQLAGGAIDCRADLYALGGVLYEAAVGRPPFEASDLYALLQRIQAAAPTPPGALVAGLPARFDQVVLRALAKRPEERFGSAAEMAAALQPLLARQATPAPASPRAEAPLEQTLARVPMAVVEGTASAALVAGLVRRWLASPVARQPTARLLRRILERPLHAPAFCGAVEVPGACLLVCEGLLYAAFDPATGRQGDAVLDALPPEVDATLHAVPAGVEHRVVQLLASAVLPPRPRQQGLEAAYTDLPRLAEKLGREGFDGVLRLARGPALGLALFSKGRRALDLFGAGWPALAAPRRWEEWVGESGAVASVEERRAEFPSFTFREQLGDLELEVVRAPPRSAGAVRVDTREEAAALRLRPPEATAARLRRGESTLLALVEQAPAHRLACWALTELAPQFEQYGRAPRWRALVEPLAEVKRVRLYHPLAGATFEAVTFAADGRPLHLLDRAPVGDRAAVQAFLQRALAAKEAVGAAGLGAAVLVAPRFSDDGLQAYLEALGERRTLFAGLEALGHREGYLRLSARAGLHVLLVEEAGGRRRPLMPGG